MSETDSPQAFGTWMECMRNGAFEEAWKFSDVALATGTNRNYTLPRHQQGIWDGRSLQDKRVLVRCYHGLGDTIQFIRFAPLLKQIARQVIVWAQPALIDLLKTVNGIDELLSLHDGTPDVAYDVDVEVMELPYIFRTTLATLPKQMPYLHAEPLPLPQQNAEKLSVGLVWQAGDWDKSRCIPFSLLEPLAQMEGINLYILQANVTSASWQEGFGIHPGEFSLYDYGRVIAGLDLLITVDSMPAHLAGALNIPVWTLLHAQADWRWMDNRLDSPWYPSMKLYRQEHQGNWQPVIEQVATGLRSLVNSVL
ncbi:glycosyltransferase family 9 protein [Mucilaginibacter robiniae]|uniref:Glycosyltransferase family 9 protein n=1 Tax=Mucilaginibacter robiniae TaxID=2728022 RepID=A0A7L5E2P7_9SPHI|nr:glycosyltransferase family 9 protein [Mucilaginibacter robiniae]QJD96828.1 glycosyltransferase family 9 protein [Mucilaginibacter robiniae]